VSISPVVTAVLALLSEEPMHAYRMQQLMKQRGVDLVVNVRNRSGLYAAIDRLCRDDLIRVHVVESGLRHPDRTVYTITAAGRERLLAGLRDGLASPTADFPLFPAIVSFLHLLQPADAQEHLTRRTAVLQARLDNTNAVLAASRDAHVPRVHLLEHEYLQSATAAELSWVRQVIADLDSGLLWWEQ
jgi:DNA-binding PadR family transcriptional regulator